MSREKLIGEMAKILTEYEDCGDCNNCPYHECCGEERIATELYNAGYRKQKEGEWEVKIFPLTRDKKVTCSCCGYSENRGPCWDISWGMHKFCPNCGAKMKGGAE